MSDIRQVEQLAKKLIDFDTENFDDRAGGYTLELLEYVKKFLADHGVGSKIYRYGSEREISGKTVRLGKRGILISDFESKKPAIIFQGHADTVPIARRHEDGICRIQKGVIHGRGAVDMKGSLAAMILAVVELRKDPASGSQPVLVITSDEEAGGFAGIRQFLDLRKEKQLDARFAICGEATDFRIKQDFLGAMYLKFSFTGKSGHAANKKRGDNAIEKAAAFLSDLIVYQAKIDKDKTALGQAVLNIGTIRGGEKVNQIPTHCEVEVSLRSIRDNRIYEKELRKLAQRHQGKMKTVFSFPPIRLATDGYLAKLQRARGKSTPTPMKEFTEATLLNRSGIRTVVFGPGNPLLNHSDQEHINSIELLRYQEILERFIRSLGD